MSTGTSFEVWRGIFFSGGIGVTGLMIICLVVEVLLRKIKMWRANGEDPLLLQKGFAIVALAATMLSFVAWILR
jgi:hypothetical protein